MAVTINLLALLAKQRRFFPERNVRMRARERERETALLLTAKHVFVCSCVCGGMGVKSARLCEYSIQKYSRESKKEYA